MDIGDIVIPTSDGSAFKAGEVGVVVNKENNFNEWMLVEFVHYDEKRHNGHGFGPRGYYYFIKAAQLQVIG